MGNYCKSIFSELRRGTGRRENIIDWRLGKGQDSL